MDLSTLSPSRESKRAGAFSFVSFVAEENKRVEGVGFFKYKQGKEGVFSFPCCSVEEENFGYDFPIS
jgi:hypothetical protein